IHLGMILNRHQRLRAQRWRAPVPEETRFPREVEQRRRLPNTETIAYAHTDASRIGERGLAVMTRRARKRSIAREQRFMKKFFAERHAFLDERVVSRQIRNRKSRAHGEAKRRVRGGK